MITYMNTLIRDGGWVPVPRRMVGRRKSELCMLIMENDRIYLESTISACLLNIRIELTNDPRLFP